MNYNWLLPICKENPTKASAAQKNGLKLTLVETHFWFLYSANCGAQQVPSGFYLTDAMLVLDKRMMGCLLVPEAGGTKKDAAAQESKRLKRLLGALRHLYRNCYLAPAV